MLLQKQNDRLDYSIVSHLAVASGDKNKNIKTGAEQWLNVLQVTARWIPCCISETPPSWYPRMGSPMQCSS